jgi:hypothetical protein
MRNTNVLKCLAAALFIITAPFSAFAEEGKQLSIGSLIGSYDGIMEIHMTKTVELSYQAEITPVENDANSVSLTAHCMKCEPYQNWKRDNCKITEISESIKFTCKTKRADEVYVYNGDRLKMSGTGAKYVYSIIAKKIVKD